MPVQDPECSANTRGERAKIPKSTLVHQDLNVFGSELHLWERSWVAAYFPSTHQSSAFTADLQCVAGRMRFPGSSVPTYIIPKNTTIKIGKNVGMSKANPACGRRTGRCPLCRPALQKLLRHPLQ